MPVFSIYTDPTEPVRPPSLRTQSKSDLHKTALATVEEEEALYMRAVATYRDHRLDEAEQMARTLLFGRPDHARTLLLLAYIAADRQDIDEAHSYIDRVLRQDRLNAEAYYLRSLLHEESGDTAQAEGELRAALYCQRDHPLTLYRLWKLLDASGDEARAAQVLAGLKRSLEARDDDAFINDYSELRVRHLRELAGR